MPGGQTPTSEVSITPAGTHSSGENISAPPFTDSEAVFGGLLLVKTPARPGTSTSGVSDQISTNSAWQNDMNSRHLVRYHERTQGIELKGTFSSG